MSKYLYFGVLDNFGLQNAGKYVLDFSLYNANGSSGRSGRSGIMDGITKSVGIGSNKHKDSLKHHEYYIK